MLMEKQNPFLNEQIERIHKFIIPIKFVLSKRIDARASSERSHDSFLSIYTYVQVIVQN